jgi:predicted N-acetyltransferase YhbS
MIQYAVENDLDPQEFKELLINSTLGERRPVDDLERLTRMVENSDILVTARDGGKLVGIARSISDFSFCTYLSDLAVDLSYQHRGIGTELIRQTKLAAPQGKLILLSAPKAIAYYPKIGMKHHDQCFFIDHVEELKNS